MKTSYYFQFKIAGHRARIAGHSDRVLAIIYITAGTSDEFGIGVVVYQGSPLSPLLFVVVMQEAARAARGERLWDLLYADDLVITAESEEEAVRKFGVWKREMATRGLKVNINKTKLMVMGRELAVRPQRGSYPCGVCGKGVVRANSVWCQCCGAQKSEKSRR